jgi:hypothetical protein
MGRRGAVQGSAGSAWARRWGGAALAGCKAGSLCGEADVLEQARARRRRRSSSSSSSSAAHPLLVVPVLLVLALLLHRLLLLLGVLQLLLLALLPGQLLLLLLLELARAKLGLRLGLAVYQVERLLL